MKRVAQVHAQTEPGFPVLLPALPALVCVLLAQAWLSLILTLRFPPGLDEPEDEES